MTIKDKDFKIFIPEEEILQTVSRLAADISRDSVGQHLLVCPVLTGAFLFASDLVRRLTVPCEVSFVKYTSYQGMSSTGRVTCHLPFPSSVEGRDVLVVEDVIDSGLTMRHILNELQALKPRSVRLCSLFFKPAAFRGDYRVDYIGREIGDEFIVGYGLDYDDLGRQLKDIWVVN